MILRNFLYLDNAMLDDYLSTLEGYLIESGEVINNKSTKTSGKVGIKMFDGGREIDSESGTINKVQQTSAGKFQRLYEALETNSMLQYLEGFDHAIWTSIKRQEILEIPGIISIPKMYNTIQSVGNLSPLLDLMQAFGKSDIIKPKDMEAVNGIKAISDIDKGKNIPVIIDLEDNKNYKFTAMLKPDNLKVDIEEIEGNITIIGKVQKIISKGENYDVFSIVKGIDNIMKSQNREQRRKYNKSKSEEVSDSIKGPAMVIIPLAIFR